MNDTPGQDGQSSPEGRRVRLQRLLADAGVAARRTCEAMIEAGRVRVNGEVVRRLPVFVDPERDRIEVDGVGIRRDIRSIYIMLHKPERVLVTTGDEPGADRPTVMQYVDHPSRERLFPVGRLDFASTGLVLLTNDGELANRLTHPRFGVTKTYQAVVRGDLDDAALDAIRVKAGLAKVQGRGQERLRALRSGGGEAPPSTGELGLRIVKREAGRTLLEVTLREARNRELRDILAHLGMPVKKLARVAIGTLELRGLAVGQWRELTRDEVRQLRDATSRPGRAPRQTRARKAHLVISSRPAARKPRGDRANKERPARRGEGFGRGKGPPRRRDGGGRR